MKAKLKKKSFIILLFSLGVVCEVGYAQTTEIEATLPDPCMTLSIDNNKDYDNFVLYPNPSNGIVKIQFDTTLNVDDMSITIYDTKGKIVYRENYLTNIDNLLTLNVEYLTTGIYFIIVQSGDFASTKKLIIK